MIWLKIYLEDKIDPKQFGGLKGNSTAHYLIELINHALYSQDLDPKNASLLCTIDFSKAYNRQNHHILVTKLSDMGVPGWLLNLVMGYLSEREMVVRYRGETSAPRPLPGGGPQGGLLGGLLFLVLINDLGFKDSNTNVGKTINKRAKNLDKKVLHAKFVDDMSLEETLNLKEVLEENPERQQPDQYRSRTGHKLSIQKSSIYHEIKRIEKYTIEN